MNTPAFEDESTVYNEALSWTSMHTEEDLSVLGTSCLPVRLLSIVEMDT